MLAELRGHGASAAVLRDLLEARKIVECEVAALAAERADDADRAALDGSAGDDARRTRRTHRRSSVADSAFHRTLVRAARNRVLERMAQPMHALLSYSQALTDAIPGVLDRALAEHEAIAVAVARHDAAGARRAMHTHLAHTERDVNALTEAP